MSTQLQEWKGQFGREYTDRNVVDWASRAEGFDAIFESAPGPIGTVLEVGCNRGHNLEAIVEDRYPAVVGVEPNPYARRIALDRGLIVLPGDAYALPFDDASFDLVFTSGVLIHVPPDRLEDAMAEIVRVSRRYVLAIEYYAETDTEVRYRDRDGLMWNRDYGAHYLSLQGGSGHSIVRSGDLGPEFDGARFWLLEKSSALRSG